MFSWTQFFLTGAFVLPAMIRVLNNTAVGEALAASALAVLLIAALLAKIMHDENSAETPETCKERERRAERYTSFKNDRDEDG